MTNFERRTSEEEDFEEEGLRKGTSRKDFEGRNFERKGLRTTVLREADFDDENFFDDDDEKKRTTKNRRRGIRIEEPSEEEIQARIKESKGAEFPFDTGSW